MKIEIWSDFVCPFCYIGKRSMEHALDEFEHKDKVKIEYKCYELDPDAKVDSNLNIHEYLSIRKGLPLDYVKQMNENVGKQAAAIGLTYNFDTIKHTNTFNAHRVVKYAETRNLGKEMTEKILHAYFTDSELISDATTLQRLALEVGLEKEEIEEVLATNRFSRRVREDVDLAKELNVQGVPFFVFNEKYALSGAQPKEVFIQILNKVWEEESNSDQYKKNDKTSYCTDEGCELKE